MKSAYRYPGSLSGSGPSGSTIIAICAILAVMVLGGIGCADYLQDSPQRVSVTGKESVSTGDGHEYRIYADDEIYVMADSIFKGRFRTGNDYARIQPGHTYECTKFGWRVPLFSMMQNIRNCKEVTP